MTKQFLIVSWKWMKMGKHMIRQNSCSLFYWHALVLDEMSRVCFTLCELG